VAPLPLGSQSAPDEFDAPSTELERAPRLSVSCVGGCLRDRAQTQLSASAITQNSQRWTAGPTGQTLASACLLLRLLTRRRRRQTTSTSPGQNHHGRIAPGLSCRGFAGQRIINMSCLRDARPSSTHLTTRFSAIIIIPVRYSMSVFFRSKTIRFRVAPLGHAEPFCCA